MSWNPKDDFSEYYDQSSSHIDYSDPAYYKSETPKAPRSAQPVQSLDPSTIYPTFAHELPSDKLDSDAELMTPYRGPSSIEGYTEDIGAEQREAAKPGTAEGGNKRKGLVGLGGLGAALSALLLKFPLLAPLLKFGWLGFSALFSVAVYSLIFGWQFAIGLVLLLFVHEMGHAVIMKQMPKNAKDEAEVGIAGPIAGAIAAMVCLALARNNPGTPIWAPLAYFGFGINLFILISIAR